MSAGIKIQRRENVASRAPREGESALAALIEVLGDLGAAAEPTTQGELVRLCRVGRAALGRLQGEPQLIERHRPRILEHIDRVTAYATGLAVVDAAASPPLAPPLLSLPDQDEERHFLATLAMFVGDASARVTGLEAALQAAGAAADPDAARRVRETVHGLAVEFGVLQLTEARSLALQAVCALDACAAHGCPLPVTALQRLVEWLRRHLTALQRDPAARPPSSVPVQRQLAAIDLTGPVHAAAGEAGADARVRVLVVAAGRCADLRLDSGDMVQQLVDATAARA